jgi:hypothetical protein
MNMLSFKSYKSYYTLGGKLMRYLLVFLTLIIFQLPTDLLFCAFSSIAFSEQALPEPYSSIEVLPFDGQGWFHNAAELESLIDTRQVKTVIEVGSWLGLSTRFTASLLPKGGKLYAVDHWLGSAEHQPGEWAYYPALPYLYQQFLSNVIHSDLTEKIVPVRMASLDAANYLRTLENPIMPDLIYLDASHETESVYADLNAWYPYVEQHGIMCGDDWIWSSVQIAVRTFAHEKGLRIEASGNFWYLTK